MGDTLLCDLDFERFIYINEETFFRFLPEIRKSFILHTQ